MEVNNRYILCGDAGSYVRTHRLWEVTSRVNWFDEVRRRAVERLGREIQTNMQMRSRRQQPGARIWKGKRECKRRRLQHLSTITEQQNHQHFEGELLVWYLLRHSADSFLFTLFYKRSILLLYILLGGTYSIISHKVEHHETTTENGLCRILPETITERGTPRNRPLKVPQKVEHQEIDLESTTEGRTRRNRHLKVPQMLEYPEIYLWKYHKMWNIKKSTFESTTEGGTSRNRPSKAPQKVEHQEINLWKYHRMWNIKKSTFENTAEGGTSRNRPWNYYWRWNT